VADPPGGDPQVIGSTIRIGGAPHTVVGVMPRGFLFPVRDFLWLPFRYNALAYAPGAGPTGTIVGRLKAGVSLEAARKEMEFVGERMASQFATTHAQLRPQVLPYTGVLTGMDSTEAKVGVAVTQILAFLLLALACGNVGILILARAATRTQEIAIRTAIGASRLRIVSQLFIESLLLAAGAAGLGLLILQVVARGPDYLLTGLPYWVDFDVSVRTAGLALSLAIVSAVIAGVVPALKATGKRVQASIQRASTGGSGIRFGKGYSTLIIAEVAVSVLLLALLGSALLPTALSKPGALGIPTDQYLYASIRLSRADATPGSLALTHNELIRRLAAEPGVGKVAIASNLPGMSHEVRYVQIEGLLREAGAAAPAWLVNLARVDVGYFDALQRPILNGRNFSRADLGADRSAVIVNQSFVQRVLGGRNPIGRRLRYWEPGQEPGPWSYEVVGVVGSLGMNAVAAERDEGLYQVAAPGELHPLRFALHMSGDPERFAPRLRAIVSSIDPGVLLQNPVVLSNVPNPERRVMTLTTLLFALLAGIAVVLAAACLYALMSFTVTERTREYGIRTALGARPARIVSTVGKRAFLQLGSGVLVGAALSALVLAQSSGRNSALIPTANWHLTVGVIALFVVAVGLLACARPTLRLIRIQPLEALKS
jgi:predicted permease